MVFVSAHSPPFYCPNVFSVTQEDLDSVPWVSRTEARRECFMSEVPRKYLYGSYNGARTYLSSPIQKWVADIMSDIPGAPNVCFLNRYEHDRQALGWHSDDSPDTSSHHPISVVSFGEPREIWWRCIGEKGVVPEANRRLLEHGSMFVMPGGFQGLYQHRIPKGSRPMGPRVSLTFRHMLDCSLL